MNRRRRARRDCRKPRRACRLVRSALVHDHDAVGELERLLLVVRDENGGVAGLVVDLAKPLRSSLRTCASSAPNGSSSSSTFGSIAKRAGQRHALPLAAGKLVRIAVIQAAQLHEIEQLHRAALDFGVRPAGSRAGEPSGRRRYSRARSCGGTTHSAGTQSRHCAPARSCARRPRRRRRSAVGRAFEAGDQPQQRGLARARRPQQRNQLA